MKKLSFKILILSAIIFAFDYSLGMILLKIARSQQFDNRIGLIIEKKIDAEMFILGSSRAARNLIAEDITKITNIKTYNLGFPGSSVEFHNFIIKLLLSNGYLPKYVTLVVDDDNQLIENNSINFRKDVLWPYVDNELIYEKLTENHKVDNKILDYSRLRKYNNLFFDMLSTKFFAKSSKKNDPNNYITEMGSMPLHGKSPYYNKITRDGQINNYKKDKESARLIEEFSEIVNICHNNSINVFIVFPPNFYNRTIGFSERILELSGNKIVPFDYSESVLTDKKFYYDNSHLDAHGAKLFTNIFASELNLYLEQNIPFSKQL